MIKFVFGWIRNNLRFVSIYGVAIVSMCAITLLLSDFFVDESFYKKSDDDKKYGFLLKKEISFDQAMQIIDEVGVELDLIEEVELASNTYRYYDDYGIMTSVVSDVTTSYGKDLVYGYMSDEKNTYVSFSNYKPLIINDKAYEKTGEGGLLCAGKYVSYYINVDDYRDSALNTSCIEFVMTDVLEKSQEEKVKEIVKEYAGQYDYVHLSGFSEDGFSSVFNTLLVATALFGLACFSILVFLEVALHLQGTDIKILRMCGATRAKIEITYIFLNIVLLLVGYTISVIIAMIIDDDLNMISVLLDGIVVFVVYTLLTIVYVNKTIGQVDSVYKKGIR